MEINQKKYLKQWDYWRNEIANGDTGSSPQDWFESVLDDYDDKIIHIESVLKEYIKDYEDGLLPLVSSKYFYDIFRKTLEVNGK